MISFNKIKSLNGEVKAPPDKSITHRSLIISAMAEGTSRVTNPLISLDTKATVEAVSSLGIDLKRSKNLIEITSKGYRLFKEPENIIDCGNSGTTARLLTGLFTPTRKYYVLTGDSSLRERPMKRVIDPLKKMGALISGRYSDTKLPITIMPSTMKSSTIFQETHSAQVKSAIILASLQLEGATTYVEKIKTRNHTEVLLQLCSDSININDDHIIIQGGLTLEAGDFMVPGDFSSAAFFIFATLIFEKSKVTIKNCGLNPSRIGFINVLKDLGVKIEYSIDNNHGEPYGNIFIGSQDIKGGLISGKVIPNVIDELPIIAYLGLFAASPIEIRGASELRFKESDRIGSVVYNLKQLGAEVHEYNDGLKVFPPKTINKKCILKSFKDHRIAIINTIIAKKFGQDILLDDISCMNISFPTFMETFAEIEEEC